VGVRQERNCGTNDISIIVFPISKILYADLIELTVRLRRNLLKHSIDQCRSMTDSSDRFFSTKRRRCLMYWRFCLASLRQQYGDDQTPTITQKFEVSMIFDRWQMTTHESWLHDDFSGTVRVAQYILHSKCYDMHRYVQFVWDYGCCLSRIFALLSSVVTLRLIACLTCVLLTRSARPLSCTRRLFQKDATNVGERLGQSSWEKGMKIIKFQVYSVERNYGNLSTPLLSNGPTLFDLPRLPHRLNRTDPNPISSEWFITRNCENVQCWVTLQIKPNQHIECTYIQYYTLLQQYDIDQWMTKIRQSPGHLADEATKHVFIFNEKSLIGTLKRCRYS